MAMQRLDDRSEKTIAGLLPPAQTACRAFLAGAAAWLAEHAPGVTIRAISGLRTFPEQDALYAQGRTAPGNRVTNARAGSSWHNYGVAWDIGLFRGNDYLEDSPFYGHLGAVGQAQGLEWGGGWKTFKDMPHYQLRLGFLIGEAKRRHYAGESLFTGKAVTVVTATVEATPRPWTVNAPGGSRIVDAAHTAGVRAAAELLGGVVSVDGTTRTITLTPPKV